MNPFIERHQDSITGVLSCFDRVVITGTLPDICYAGAMAGFLSYHKIRIFDYPDWANGMRDEIRQHTEGLAQQKYLHYYFYFIDEVFGLCYLRFPTWAPLRLQIYFNGHAWLARKLDQAGINFEVLDNAFLTVSDPDRAQQLADSLDAKQLHRWARTYFRGEWSISGFRARDLRAHIQGLSSSPSSYLLKRLRTHGLIKKVGHCYKCYLTKIGRRVLATSLKLKQQLIIPSLCQNPV